jgi:hypothetical protein
MPGNKEEMRLRDTCKKEIAKQTKNYMGFLRKRFIE